MPCIPHLVPAENPQGSRPFVVTCILTLNEEINIAQVIGSAKAISDAIVVVDSGSIDRTVEAASAEGAKVWHRDFDAEHLQRNWAADRIEHEWPGAWLLEIDADERLSPGLITEIRHLLAEGVANDVYFVPFRFIFDGRLLRFGASRHTRLPRFRRATAGHYQDREVNPHWIPTTKWLGRLESHIIHTDVNSWEHHIEKHNRYSSLEARARNRAMAHPESRVGTLSAIRYPHLRRRWVLERVWNRLPAKPVLLFINNYVVHGGCLDGRAGLRSAVFRSWQVMCTDLKYKSLQSRGRFERPPPPMMPSQASTGEVRLVVCILTLNEEDHIVEAISSARSVTNDVIVVDSYSTDSTVTLAAAAGAKVWTLTFRNLGSLRNWALDRIQGEFGDPWVLFLDAKERLSPRLVQELRATLDRETTQYDAYLIEHTLIFAGRALRFGGTGTKWARLLKASAGRHEEMADNDRLILHGGSRLSRMGGRIIHQDVRDWERFVTKQNKYSTLQARELLNRDTGQRTVTLRQAVANPPLRRRWLRQTIWPLIPLKPMVRFLQIYVVLGSILDGYAGLCLAIMQAWQEMCVELKYQEMKSRTAT
jgi:glycosyltransferase involved in cell wall biosynthesis